jgi:hypothetical protein
MRLLATLLAFSLAALMSMPTVGDDNEPADRCESTDCFNQLRIRNFEVIDETTLIVFVGQQECPCLVELTGTFCDVTYLPGFDIVFRPTDRRMAREPGLGARNLGGFRAPGNTSYSRVCSNDLHMGLEEGPFSTAGGAPQEIDDQSGLSCRIRNITSLTDDERLEIYVDNRFVQPPPPFGVGRVEAPEPADGDSQASDRGEDGAAGAGSGEPD